VLLDFWFKGCGPCVRIHPLLDSLRSSISDRRFRLISICLDYQGEGRNVWLDAIKSGKYTSFDVQNLIAQTKDKADSAAIIGKYRIMACPTLILIDKAGKIARQSLDVRADRGYDLMSEIAKELRK
jgi:thiol-disulfide isomerase/thioredoxin